jgi:hypothetical protein
MHALGLFDQGGCQSLIVNSSDLCATKNHAGTRMQGTPWQGSAIHSWCGCWLRQEAPD